MRWLQQNLRPEVRKELCYQREGRTLVGSTSNTAHQAPLPSFTIQHAHGPGLCPQPLLSAKA